jgi:ubiquinone/menaquinone biosynthesis C-methylase UbiE
MKENVMSNPLVTIEPEDESACCSSSCCPGGDATPMQDIREVVKQRYGQAVRALAQGAKPSCCGSSVKDAATGMGGTDPITRDLYATDQTSGLPEEALLASFGCGNPTTLAELQPGETVLDLGSGGGIDVLLSARRVGPTGKAYGLDMTDEMLALAEKNRAKAGATNVAFLRGTIEAIPLPDGTVDVVISNCVINLSGDKDKVLREAFRVLKPGGRFAVSDIVLRRELPESARKSMTLWTGCVAGALVEAEYVGKLRETGFRDITVEATRIYDKEEVAEVASSSCCGGDMTETLAALDGAIMSAFIRAKKP